MKINNLPALPKVSPPHRKFLSLSTIVLALSLATPAVHAQVYDATTDFSVTNGNPNGVWEYGYTIGLGGSFIRFNDPLPPSGGSMVELWRDLGSGLSRTDIPSAQKNVGTTTTFNNILPGQFVLHPGPSNSYAVLRFTAPATTNYTLTSQYLSGDVFGETSIDVYKNSGSGAPLFSSATTSSNPSFNSTISLNIGDTLSFAVGQAGDGFQSDATPLNVQLTTVSAPEPTTITLLSLGGLGILARRRKVGK
jgi:hypothetical protein